MVYGLLFEVILFSVNDCFELLVIFFRSSLETFEFTINEMNPADEVTVNHLFEGEVVEGKLKL